MDKTDRAPAGGRGSEWMENMVGCSHAQELTTPFVDGELDAGAQAQMEAHLSGCPSCRLLVEREVATRTLLTARRERLREPAPPHLRAAVEAMGQAKPSRPRRVFAPLPMAASVLLALGGVFLYGLLGAGGTALAGQLALDHFKCVRIVADRHPSSDVRTAAVDWERDHGWAVRLPEAPTGFRFVELRHCLHSHGLMAHALYRHGDELVSLYIVPRVVPNVGVQEIMGERTAIWTQAGRTYAVVGAGSQAELDAFAALARQSAR